MNETQVRENLFRIQEDIVPCKPRIIAITKYFGTEAIIAAYNCGIRDFGESRAVEATEKIKALPEEIRRNSTFHFIGHLQTNKVKLVVGKFDYIHSVDSVKLAQAINSKAAELGIIQKILIQINNANEEQKFGFSKESLFQVFEQLKEFRAIDIVGLMNIAPIGISALELQHLFEDIAQTKKQLEENFHCNLKELSMGMSQDYKIAAQSGATMLRIGRKLFK